MSSRRAKIGTGVQVLLLTGALTFLSVLVLDTIWVRRGRTRVCIDCGAREHETWTQFAGVRYEEHKRREWPPLAGLHLRLLGPCNHEWVLLADNGRGRFGGPGP